MINSKYFSSLLSALAIAGCVPNQVVKPVYQAIVQEPQKPPEPKLEVTISTDKKQYPECQASYPAKECELPRFRVECSEPCAFSVYTRNTTKPLSKLYPWGVGEENFYINEEKIYEFRVPQLEMLADGGKETVIKVVATKLDKMSSGFCHTTLQRYEQWGNGDCKSDAEGETAIKVVKK